jgi:hypothetical protein
VATIQREEGVEREVVVIDDGSMDEAAVRSAGQDREWTARVRAHGRSIEREPSALVQHAPALGLPGSSLQHVRYAGRPPVS